MRKLNFNELPLIIGGANCDRIGARLMKLHAKGRDISRNARRYVSLGCADVPADN